MRKIISLCVIYCTVFLCLATNIVYADSVIILDPGHTKIRYGTKSCSGGHEFQYNNEMTDFIEEYLKSNNIQVLKTRSVNQEISLKGRTENSSGKAIFISIHHDSAQEKYISYENGNPCSNYASGYSIFVSHKNPFFEDSLQYAKILGRNLRRLGLTPTLHHAEKIHGENRELIDKELGIYRFDDLVVLRTAKCPAVLFESGVIINPYDDQLVKTHEYKNKVAESMLEMVKTAIVKKNDNK